MTFFNGYRHSFSVMGVRTYWYSTAHLTVWCLQNLADTPQGWSERSASRDVLNLQPGKGNLNPNLPRLAFVGDLRSSQDDSNPWKILAQIFPPKQANQPQCCSVHSSEFSTMVYINYYYPLIFHRFTPDFPRVFLLLAIYSLISHHIPLIHMISSYPLVN